MLSDFGATVLRVTKPLIQADDIEKLQNSGAVFPGIKSIISLNLKNPQGLSLLKDVLTRVDVLIEPFRPGVLESIGLAPDELLKRNPRLIVARLTGFRRDGPYANMAGHDINYLAISGILSQLGRANGAPYPPANILADFAGGGLMCTFGILMALLKRSTTGKGQIVESNMVDGTAYLGTFMRLMSKTPLWDQPRGFNYLDGGAPWYEVYECKGGSYMAVGALEPQFFRELLKGLELGDQWMTKRHDRSNWDVLRDLLRSQFLEKTRAEWEIVFTGKDACCTPVLSQGELEASNHEQRSAVRLDLSPGRNQHSRVSVDNNFQAYYDGGEKTLHEWMDWKKGIDYKEHHNGLAKCLPAKL